MKIKINEKEYDLHYSLRIYMIYENVANKKLDATNIGLEDLILLFYCAIIATLQYNKVELMSYLDFLDYIDDNGGEMLVVKFGQWFAEQVEIQAKLSQEGLADNKTSKKN